MLFVASILIQLLVLCELAKSHQNKEDAIALVLPAQTTWTRLPGSLTQVDVSEGENLAVGVNKNDEVYRWNWFTRSYQRLPGRMSQVTICPNGDIWGVNRLQEIYSLPDGSKEWTRIPGKLHELSCGASGLWGVTRSREVYRWVESNWQRMPGNLKMVTSGGQVWGIDSNGSVFHWNGERWVAQASGNIQYISAGSGSSLMGINRQGQVLYFYQARWHLIPGRLESIGVGSWGSILGTNQGGEVYQWYW